jgi:mRNA interferase MazF
VRPALIVSVDEFNQGPAEKVIVVPCTSQEYPIPSHVRFDYTDTRDGSRVTTYFCCEDVRSISVERLKVRMAPRPIPARIMAQIEERLRTLLRL